MKQINLTVQFITPAFLGDAAQRGAWRVPPFKAQLRYWWRFVYASEHGFWVKIDKMRQAEGELFGTASGGAGQASKVRLRLDRWRKGQMSNLEKPAIERGVYLGYGPVTNKGLKNPPAIKHDEQATLKVGFQMGENGLSDKQIEQVQKALSLMHHFGQIGGRSRNGWGSYVLEGDLKKISVHSFVRDWHDALRLEWPHAIGSDGQPLIWQTEPMDNWRALIDKFAQLRRDLNRLAGQRDLRYLLSCPVKKRCSPGVQRQPNTLRFKAMLNEQGQLYGRIYHTPCTPKSVSKQDVERLWTEIHRRLNKGYQREKV